jgi:hypothetical protein
MPIIFLQGGNKTSTFLYCSNTNTKTGVQQLDLLGGCTTQTKSIPLNSLILTDLLTISA